MFCNLVSTTLQEADDLWSFFLYGIGNLLTRLGF
jgi:hypothetical protein